MIELRKRLHSKSYQQLNCDEDEDNDNETTELLTKKPNWEHFTHFDEPQQPKAKSASCLWVLVCLSISGIFFLSFVAHLLETNSLYLKVSKANEDKKRDLAAGVEGAILLYFLTAICCIWRIYSRPDDTNKNHHLL